MIAHLRRRDEALVALGWSPAEAQWLALVSLHSGLFVADQLGTQRKFDQPMTISRLMKKLVARSAAVLETWPFDQRFLMCHVTSRAIYRALGAEHVRHRRAAEPQILWRRLLSLDYVIDHIERNWLPTEEEKVQYFERALGIDRKLLPVRAYGSRPTGKTHRYFPIKMPIAVNSADVTFVYVDDNVANATGVQEWGAAHEKLWEALRQQGIHVRVVIVSWQQTALAHAGAIVKQWIAPGGQARTAARELAKIRTAIREVDTSALEGYGGLNEALHRCAVLEAAGQQSAMKCDSYTTWYSLRIAALSSAGIDRE